MPTKLPTEMLLLVAILGMLLSNAREIWSVTCLSRKRYEFLGRIRTK